MDTPQDRAIELMQAQVEPRLNRLHYDLAGVQYSLDNRREALVDLMATLSQLATIAPEETHRQMQFIQNFNGQHMSIPRRLRALRKSYEDFGAVLDLLIPMIEPYDPS